MARIRSIKPEFWSSAQVVECSVNARLLFIGLWNFCDDAGRTDDLPRQIKMKVFPGDDFTADDIHGFLSELAVNGLIIRYEADGKRFLQVTGWHHQKINRPNPSKIPEPPDTSHGAITEPHPPEGKGKEEEGKTPSPDPNGSSEGRAEVAPPDGDGQVDLDKLLYQRGKQLLGKSAGGQITKLKQAHGTGKALELLDLASRKEDPAEYVAGILRSGVAEGGPDDDFEFRKYLPQPELDPEQKRKRDEMLGVAERPKPAPAPNPGPIPDFLDRRRESNREQGDG